MEGTSQLHQPALAAYQILTAMRAGNLRELETGLEQAEQLAVRGRQPETSDGEQMELLGAVAGQMRQSIARFGQRLTPHLEGMEVDIRLLRHLAATSRAVMTAS